uniref:RNA-directed DNA polymerase n=1 Tax=Bracon brevicornis TaxID=1563983 RepID=A0A6V7LZN9_9HYME
MSRRPFAGDIFSEADKALQNIRRSTRRALNFGNSVEEQDTVSELNSEQRFQRGVGVPRQYDLTFGSMALPSDSMVDEHIARMRADLGTLQDSTRRGEDSHQGNLDDDLPGTPISVPPGSVIGGFFTPNDERRVRFENDALREKVRQLCGQGEERAKLAADLLERMDWIDNRLYREMEERNRYKAELEEALRALNDRGRENWMFSNGDAGPATGRNRSGDDDYLSLKSALSLVRDFQGNNAEDLASFLSSCETAKKQVHPSKSGRLLEMILGCKLVGKALLQLKHKTVSTFDELKKELEALFGKSESLIGLQIEFNKLQQKPEEDVTKFVARAERVSMELVEVILSTNNDLGDEGKEGVRRGILTLAKANFEQGLRGQLQILVRSHNYKTLHKSCIGAIELDKTISTHVGGNHNNMGARIKPGTYGNSAKNFQNNNRQSSGRMSSGGISCFVCGQNHLAKFCTAAKGGQRKSILPAPDRQSVNAFSQVCKFCNNVGHDAMSCYRLKRKIGIPDSAKLRADGTHNSSNKPSTARGNNNEKKKEGDNGSKDDKLPIGAFQIFTVNENAGDIESELATRVDTTDDVPTFEVTRKMIKARDPKKQKSHVMIEADELKQATMFLWDSGASTSVIKTGLLRKGTEIREGNKLLRGIADTDVVTSGTVVLYLKIGDQELGHVFHVVPDSFPCIGGILGEDFIEAEDLIMSVDPGRCVIINGVEFKFLRGRKPIKIEARTEKLTWIELEDLGSDIGVISKREVQDGVFLGQCLTKGKDGRAIVCVINTTERDVYLDIPRVELETLPSCDTLDVMQLGGISQRNRIKLLHENLRLDDLNEEERSSILEILEEYNSTVQLPGDSPGITNHLEHAIPTLPGKPAVNVRPHRMPHAQKEEVERQVQEMLKNGIIRPSHSQWNAPLLVVPKKLDASGKIKFRVVVDFRKLNDITIGDSFPLPNITDILDQLGQAKYFSTLDLAAGFHQIPVKEEDKCKTAFSTPLGHYEYNRLPFGVTGGPATFQRLMNSVLTGIQGLRCFVYLDDIVVFGKNLEEHNGRLKEVLQRLKEANLRLQPDKCNFLKKEVVYLGHVISEKGVKADPTKTDAVRNFPIPKDTKLLMSFSGLASYYRKFIKDFAKIAKPLTELLKKGVPWSWEEKHQHAFDVLKEKLVTAPILQFPNFAEPFLLTTDASGKAIGAVLSQGEIGKDLPIAYASRTLNQAELNYSTIEKELLAIVWGVKHFRPYLYGRKFVVVTDHRPLRWIFNVKDPGSRLMHWRLKLEEYEFEVVHKAGKLNTNADALSRMYVITRAQRKMGAGTEDVAVQESTEDDRVVPTDEEVSVILRENHGTPFSGHPGSQRLYQKLRLKYYWKGMKRDVEDFVAACKECQLNKLGKTTKVPMVVYDAPESPFEQCAMDIVGPLTESESGNKYILTFQDALTKFSKAIAIPNQEAATVARAFVERIVCEHGAPDQLLTDQGRNFISDMFKQVCKVLRVKKIQTTSYHPQTNGALERSHRTLAEYLRNFVDEGHTDWDTWLPYALFAHNTTPHTATRKTPFELLYGRQASIPTSLKQPPRLTYSYDDYAQELRERLRASWQIAGDNIEDAKEKSKLQYDKNAKDIVFHIGDQVLMKNNMVRPGRTKKLTQPWIGPYVIVEKNSDVNYTVKSGNKKKTQRVHVNQLRPFVEL